MPDASLDPIFAYLREHSGRYSLSALREQLLQTGYDRAEVDRALAIYQQENSATPPEEVWPKALLVIPLNILLAFIALSGVNFNNGKVSPITFVALGIFCGEIPIGLLLATSPAARVWGRALAFGFLLTIGLVLLLAGFCFLAVLGKV